MESWVNVLEGGVRLLTTLGPIGTIVVSVVVGLAIVLVLVAHFRGVYAVRRADRQSLDFTDLIIGEVDKLSRRELALRADLDRRELALRADLERQERESDSHRLRAVQLQADTELMRVQLRRLIEMMRSVREGRLLPSAITEADIAEALR